MVTCTPTQATLGICALPLFVQSKEPQAAASVGATRGARTCNGRLSSRRGTWCWREWEWHYTGNIGWEYDGWLVVDLPLWKIWTPLGIIIHSSQHMESHKTCSKPPSNMFGITDFPWWNARAYWSLHSHGSSYSPYPVRELPSVSR